MMQLVVLFLSVFLANDQAGSILVSAARLTHFPSPPSLGRVGAGVFSVCWLSSATIFVGSWP